MELPFRHIVVADFEFEFGGHDFIEAAGRSGERPRPVCMVAKELRSNQTWRLWRGDFELPRRSRSAPIACSSATTALRN